MWPQRTKSQQCFPACEQPRTGWFLRVDWGSLEIRFDEVEGISSCDGADNYGCCIGGLTATRGGRSANAGVQFESKTFVIDQGFPVRS